MSGINVIRPMSDFIMGGKSAFPSFTQQSTSTTNVDVLSLDPQLNVCIPMSNQPSDSSTKITKKASKSTISKSKSPKSPKGKATKYVFPPKLPPRLVPRDKRRYLCAKCPYATDRRDLFTRHENIHRDEKPFHCYVCGKMFNRADHVKKHFLRIHRGVEYVVKLTKRIPGMNGFPSTPPVSLGTLVMNPDVVSQTTGQVIQGQRNEVYQPRINDDFENCGNKLRRKIILHSTRQLRDSSSPTVSNGSSSNDSISNGQLTGLDLSTNHGKNLGNTNTSTTNGNSMMDSSPLTNPFSNLAFRVLGPSLSPFLASKLLGFGTAAHLALAPNALMSLPQQANPMPASTTGSSLQSLCEAMKNTHPGLSSYSAIPTSVPLTNNVPLFSIPIVTSPPAQTASIADVSQPQQLSVPVLAQVPMPSTVNLVGQQSEITSKHEISSEAENRKRNKILKPKQSPKIKAAMDGIKPERNHLNVSEEEMESEAELKICEIKEKNPVKKESKSSVKNCSKIAIETRNKETCQKVVGFKTVDSKKESKKSFLGKKIVMNVSKKLTTHTSSSKQDTTTKNAISKKNQSLTSSTSCIESSCSPIRSQSTSSISSSLSLTVPVIKIESHNQVRNGPLLRTRKPNPSQSNMVEKKPTPAIDEKLFTNPKSKMKIEDTDYFCSDCGCSFLNYHSLHTHRYLLHRYIRTLSSPHCHSCGVQLQTNSFPNSSNQLTNHIQSSSTIKSDYLSGKCSLSKRFGINCCCDQRKESGDTKRPFYKSTDEIDSDETLSNLMSRRKQPQPRKLVVEEKETVGKKKPNKTGGKMCNRKMLDECLNSGMLVENLLLIKQSNLNQNFDRPKSV